MRSIGRSVWLASSALAVVLLASSADATEPRAPGELALENRLMAPCCWVQTLDVHQSPSADALRDEIHKRMVGGEGAASIEADLVQRYGTKIRAQPPGDPLRYVAVGVLAAAALAGAGLWWLVRRWAKRSLASGEPVTREPPTRDALDDRLDAELRDASS